MFFKKKTSSEILHRKLDRMKNRSTARIISSQDFDYKLASMFMFGIFILVFSIYMGYQEKYVYSHWQKTTAQIVHIEPFEKWTLKGPRAYHKLTVSYDTGGSTQTATKEYSGDFQQRASNTIAIEFNPLLTSQYRIHDDHPEFGMTIMVLLGLSMTIFPGLLLFQKNRKPKSWRKPLLLISVLFMISPFIFNSKITLTLALIGYCVGPCCLALMLLDFLTVKVSRYLKYGELRLPADSSHKNTLIPDRKTSFNKRR